MLGSRSGVVPVAADEDTPTLTEQAEESMQRLHLCSACRPGFLTRASVEMSSLLHSCVAGMTSAYSSALRDLLVQGIMAACDPAGQQPPRVQVGGTGIMCV